MAGTHVFVSTRLFAIQTKGDVGVPDRAIEIQPVSSHRFLLFFLDAFGALGGEKLQQPFLGHLIGVLIRERLEPALGTPAADGAPSVAGDAGDLAEGRPSV